MISKTKRKYIGLAGFLVTVFGVSGIGGWITSTSVGDWYQTLEKPFLNPPDWVFGPVWTLLYIMIAVSGWLVWEKAGLAKAKIAFGFYFSQLALNLGWSAIFFGFQKPLWAFLEILLLAAVILATLIKFYRIQRLAGVLFLPYLLWVIFAAYLNGAIVVLN